MSHDPNCIFCKIVEGTIPSKKVYEDAELVAFPDINPAAPIHLLLVPKTHIPTLADCTEEQQALLGRMLLLAQKLAKDAGSINGYRVTFNNGPDGGQEVYHLHLHIMAGKPPWARDSFRRQPL
jgi:histidine triad (HIT) family protein